MIEARAIIDEVGEVVTVEVSYFDQIFVTGSSRCMPEDTFDVGVGVDMAFARALQDLGKTLERESFRQVHESDRAREKAQRASQEALERKQAATYKFRCEFAELINAKLAEEKISTETERLTLGSTAQVVNTTPRSYAYTYTSSRAK